MLAEVDRCRPYFIGLLGDRYGTPAAGLTEKLKRDYPALEAVSYYDRLKLSVAPLQAQAS